ncbi:DEBR0S1_13256g1_1 [Brettanomyces bruxellensis]|uniref:DEBR0S1_13256g1_1 n=1 Tax=Dekkera bruxellensis TaxID=5007 RepID=A0A7D9CVY5_DEKBR|nr:DEBR0S1_13256g1_1 [Brettanomyces bruxellensis]
MRLKLALESTVEIRRPLTLLLNLRKICVFRFTESQLVIISSSLNEPQVWTKIAESVFQIYEVESSRHNIIVFEINIEPLYQVLRNYEKSTVTSNLSIRLQRQSPTEAESHIPKNKTAASLAIFYTEQISLNSTVNHSFNIPVRLLRASSDEMIQEPTIDDMKIAMKLPNTMIPLFRRIERYKTAEMITVIGNKSGQLKLVIDEGERKVEMQWKSQLEISLAEDVDTVGSQERIENSASNEDLNLIKPMALRLKLRYWNIGCRLIELCDAMSLIIHDTGCILHCYIDQEQKCDITFYMNGYYSDQV